MCIMDKIIEMLKNNFNIYETETDFELESWTDGGVNMFIFINKNEDILTQLKEYIENFDIDEEIDIHRQCEQYKQAFTITESVDDFRNYVEWLKDILEKLESEVNK